MARIYNFSAGPSCIAEEVLTTARQEMLDWHGSGMSVMEMSHRGAGFKAIAEQAEADLRELLSIPEGYYVLFLQGGATSQFAMVPMNLLRGKKRANYVCTGAWSKKAIAEARMFCNVQLAATSENDGFTSIPAQEAWQIDADAAYLHYTSNETIGGVEFHDIPDSAGCPLVVDMSSNILSRPVDVSRFALIYAGAQKNMGPAGITVVIVRKELVGETMPSTPSMFDYRKQADNGSMLNTPPTYNWYMLGLVLDWVKQQGGLGAMEARNRRKAAKLYDAIDSSPFYSNPVAPPCRSHMNIPFTLADPSLDGKFLVDARAEGLVELKGHRSVGGMRASIYNAMPEEGGDALIAFMAKFERRNG